MRSDVQENLIGVANQLKQMLIAFIEKQMVWNFDKFNGDFWSGTYQNMLNSIWNMIPFDKIKTQNSICFQTMYDCVQCSLKLPNKFSFD